MRTQIVTLMMIVSLTGSAFGELTNGLVGWWKLDESSGTITADSSGNGHTGYLTNSPVWCTGVSNGGLSNGANAMASTVTLGAYYASYDLTNAISLSIWLKPESLLSDFYDSPFFADDNGYYSGWWLIFYPSYQKIAFQMTGQNGNSMVSLHQLPSNVWSHVVATFDGTNAALYVNGLLDYSVKWTGAMIPAANVVQLGGSRGAVDDARIYNRALSPLEVEQLYLEYDSDGSGLPDADATILGLSTTNAYAYGDGYPNGLQLWAGINPLTNTNGPDVTNNLVGWWMLDSTNGLTAVDSSGNGFNGTLSGSTAWTNGIFGGALEFDGATGHFLAGSGGSNELLAVTTNFTIACWLNVTNMVQDVHVLSRGDSNGGYLLGWYNTYVTVFLNMPGLYFTQIYTGYISSNNWHHFAYTYNGQVVDTYLDGVFNGAYAYTNNPASAACQLFVGQSSSGSGSLNYNGLMDDLRIYSRALSPTDIAALAFASPDGDLLPSLEKLRLGLNPNSVSTTGNGLPDWWAIKYGLDPMNSNVATQVSTLPWTYGLNNLQVYQNPSVLISNNFTTLNDGIPDWWRALYFGSGTTTNSSSCASCDPDGDGIINLYEYQYGTDPLVADVLNIVVNGGNPWATNVVVQVDPLSFPYPEIMVSSSATMSNATVLDNPHVPFTYTLPSTSNATYFLFFQFASATTNAIGPVIAQAVTLDTIPPYVDITSPTNSVTNQGFVHLQATVYDPDPQNPGSPGFFRPIKVWINGTPYWNKQGTLIDIPRYAVLPNSNNVITVTVQDRAGNQSTASISVYVDPSTATNAPNISVTGLQTNTVEVLPDMPQLWAAGQMDNLNAIVTAAVNGGAPVTMNVRSNQFSSTVPLVWGTNSLVVVAADLAGNATTNLYTLVRGNSYQLAITSPPLGTFLNTNAMPVVGSVSAYKDIGLPTQTNIVSVTVNGIGTTLGAMDGNSNQTFTTTNAVPLPADGSATTLNVVVEWADGSADPPFGPFGGYFVTQQQSTMSFSEVLDCQDCVVSPIHTAASQSDYTFTGSVTGDYNSVEIDDLYFWDWDCGTGVLFDGYDYPSTNNYCTAQPTGGLEFGNEVDQAVGFSDSTCQQEDQYTWDGSLAFMATNVPPDTLAMVTFFGMDYGRTNSNMPRDLSQVTFQGQPPVALDNGGTLGGTASYPMTITGGQSYQIDCSSFGWPAAGTWNYVAGTVTRTLDSFQFGGIALQPILPDIEIAGVTSTNKQTPGGFIVCNCDTNNLTQRMEVTIQSLLVTNQSIILTIPSSLKVFTGQYAGTEVADGTVFANANLPTNLWVEGESASTSIPGSPLKVAIQGASGSSDYVNFTVIWADLTVKITGNLDLDDKAAILTNGNWPTNYLSGPGFNGYNFGGGNTLGPIDKISTPSLTYCYTVGRIEVKAILQPPGVGNIFGSNNWDMEREKVAAAYDNGALTTNWPSPVPDSSNDSAKYLNPVNNDIFAVDIPGCPLGSGTTINHTSEVYDNFTQVVWVEIGTNWYICSSIRPWSYVALVDVDNSTNTVQTNILSLIPITIPTNAAFNPR